jgi:hypothetical protein
MNERIKELLKQSCGFEYDEDGHELTPILVGKDLEKFAQLIVAECGVALSPMLRDMVSRGRAFDLIKQHFGVEE